MKSKTAFTRIDTVVMLLCFVFLLANLGAIGRAGRSRAKEAVCQANLRQWALAFAHYAADYDGFNPYGDWAHSWWRQMLPYIWPDLNATSGRKLLFCPMATKTFEPQPFKAWNYGIAPAKYGGGRWVGSYGVNPWIFSFEGNSGSRFGGFDPPQWRWRRPDAAGADNVPVFGDCASAGKGGEELDIPPEFTDSEVRRFGGDREGIGIWCLDRHDCAINIVFMDWSVRRTALKCLWKLKWHRQFDTVNSGPQEGLPYPAGWPDWMADCESCN